MNFCGCAASRARSARAEHRIPPKQTLPTTPLLETKAKPAAWRHPSFRGREPTLSKAEEAPAPQIALPSTEEGKEERIMHDSKSLAGEVGVVTGGGRGIGAAIAARLAELGATVVICGRSHGPLEKTAQCIRAAGSKCEAVECDVTDLGSVEKLASRVEQTFGRTDILVNNAGVGGFATPLHQLPPEEWERTLNTNLRGVYYMIRSFAPLMIRG